MNVHSIFDEGSPNKCAIKMILGRGLLFSSQGPSHWAGFFGTISQGKFHLHDTSCPSTAVQAGQNKK